MNFQDSVVPCVILGTSRKVAVLLETCNVSESSQVCQDYYSRSKETEAQSDPGFNPQPGTSWRTHLQLKTHYQFKRSHRLFGLEAKVLISSLTVYQLRRHLTGGHV